MPLVKNISNMAVVIYAADGDSVQVNPRAKINIEDKFLWRLPLSIKKLDIIQEKKKPIITKNLNIDNDIIKDNKSIIDNKEINDSNKKSLK